MVPEPANFMDLRVKWGLTMPASMWEEPEQSPHDRAWRGDAHLGSDAGDLQPADRSSNSTALAAVLAMCALLFLLVEIVSANIGFRLTTSITTAMENLYEGTQSVFGRGN